MLRRTVNTIPSFVPIDECRLAIDAYERCRARYSHRVGDGFFDHRVLWINSFPRRENEVRRILQRWRQRAVKRISLHAGMRLYSDSIQVVGWDGQEMPPHRDDRHPDGSPHGTPWREWASIVYLNDDFRDGEIYFPETGECYKPVAGSLVFFKGSLLHGVRAARGGKRYTSPGWYTVDPAHEDRYASVHY